MVFSGTHFYHGLLTKYHAAFGSLFSDITIKRMSTDETIEQQFTVPLHWGNKEKMLARLEAVPEADRPYALQLPVISYEFIQPIYAPDRKEISVTRNVKKIDDNPNKFKLQYNSVPFDLHYNVYIYTKSIEDGNKIVEQILPFFTPDFTISMMLIPEMEDARDIPIVKTSEPTFEDLGRQDNLAERRILIWTFQFAMKAFLWGPVKTRPMIKEIITNYRLDARIPAEGDKNFPAMPDVTSNDAPIVSTTTESPGLDSLGNPTTDPAQAIDWHLVSVDDNWTVLVRKINIVAGANT